VRRVAAACLLATATALATAAPGAADVTITFPNDGTVADYQPLDGDVTIVAGESVTWQGSFANHPLVSDTGTFPTQNNGTSFTRPFGTPGTYPYHCMIHASMTGVVTVNSAGGGGGGGGGPPPPPPPPPAPTPQPPSNPTPGQAVDATAPAAALSTVSARAAVKNGVVVRFRSTEAGSASATLTARSKTIGRAKTTYSAAGSHTMRVKLTKSGRSLVRRAKRVSATLRLVVSDASGNSARVSRAVVVRS
jgi:plastocyanin